MYQELIKEYGSFFDKNLINEIEKTGTVKAIDEDSMLIDIGQNITVMPLVLSGAIKILREDENGNELVLYFIEAGNTCAMTITCCLGKTKSEIRAIAETNTKIIMIPVEKMSEWMSKYKGWQRFILQSYHERLTEMLETIDNIAFLKLDERLIKYLRDIVNVNKDNFVKTTHQQIANDLNTSRVVISRLLKTLENNNKIELHRNAIKILDV